MRYFAIGRVVATDHPEIRKGQLLGLPLRKKWPDPYTVFYPVEDGGKTRLAYVRLKWVEIKKYPPGLTNEEKFELEKKWLEEAIERERKNSLVKWVVEPAADELYHDGQVRTVRGVKT